MPRTESLVLATILLLSACATASPSAIRPPADALEKFLYFSPGSASAPQFVTNGAHSNRTSSYENALAALVFLERGQRERAESLLLAQAELQGTEGALPFSLALPIAPKQQNYVRAGAMAWVGLAALAYLDSAPGGVGRSAITRMAHRIAAYLLASQVSASADPRSGLITGGYGTLEQKMVAGEAREEFIPGEITWASTEHNIDSYFFLEELARVAENSRFHEAATRIKNALLKHLWNETRGTFACGIGRNGLDQKQELDCSSWGALFLEAIGEKEKAQSALRVAELLFSSRDAKTGARGHKPTFSGLQGESEESGVWPEGSAGVALAAFRLGDPGRADEILAELEKLRMPNLALPDFTQPVPFEFEQAPSAAGTAWVDLVQRELHHPQKRLIFPHHP